MSNTCALDGEEPDMSAWVADNFSWLIDRDDLAKTVVRLVLGVMALLPLVGVVLILAKSQ